MYTAPKSTNESRAHYTQSPHGALTVCTPDFTQKAVCGWERVISVVGNRKDIIVPHSHPQHQRDKQPVHVFTWSPSNEHAWVLTWWWLSRGRPAGVGRCWRVSSSWSWSGWSRSWVGHAPSYLVASVRPTTDALSHRSSATTGTCEPHDLTRFLPALRGQPRRPTDRRLITAHTTPADRRLITTHTPVCKDATLCHI